MANALRRDLKKGDKIVFEDGTEAICDGSGFGRLANTRGSGLFVQIGENVVRADGFDIDVEKTLSRFSSENGWS